MPPGTIHPPKKPIQPFVPVGPGERTKLYSHRELRALTNADPRNELDELSEPLRFKKDVLKPSASSDCQADLAQSSGLLLTFLAGAAVGAVVVALTAPKTGPELCGDLKGFARRAKQEAGDMADEACGAWDDLNERIVLATGDLG